MHPQPPPEGHPLDGILVADFSRVLAGPMATMMLADLGARVVKVERPGVGDETRTWGPPFTDRGTTYFESVNRSKESLTLDLRDEADLSLARELAHRADVVIENFLPGTMDRLGLSYDAVSQDNPGVIYCSISGFGSGAGAELPGYDFVVQGVGGLMSITGMPGEPTKVGVAIVDVLTGKDAVIGILAALAARARTGRGDRIEVTLLTSALAGLVNQGQSALSTGVAPRRMGNQHPSIAPYETLTCPGGPLVVACGNDGQFARLSSVVGAPELAERPDYATNAARVTHRDALVIELETLLAQADADTWVTRLTAARVPAGKVGTIPDGVALAQSLELEPTLDVAGQAQIRHPVQWTSYGPTTPTAPPVLGEHDTALRAWLTAPPSPKHSAFPSPPDETQVTP